MEAAACHSGGRRPREAPRGPGAERGAAAVLGVGGYAGPQRHPGPRSRRLTLTAGQASGSLRTSPATSWNSAHAQASEQTGAEHPPCESVPKEPSSGDTRVLHRSTGFQPASRSTELTGPRRLRLLPLLLRLLLRPCSSSCLHQSPGTEHRAPDTEHCALSTNHRAQSTRHRALRTGN